MKPSIYFIAILPPPEIRKEIKAFKLFAQKHFDSGRALRSPAHITLEPPFKWHDAQISEVEKTLEDFAGGHYPLSIQLNNFSAFPPRVIFVDVKKNAELQNLQNSLKRILRDKLGLLSDRPERPFHPHVTIAFKDLRKAIYPQAWDHFSSINYQRSFSVRQISLLCHNGKIWEIKREFPLNSKANYD